MTNALRRLRRAVSGAATEDRRPTRRVDSPGSRSRAAESPVVVRYPLA